jgi:hypothetical protein
VKTAESQRIVRIIAQMVSVSLNNTIQFLFSDFFAFVYCPPQCQELSTDQRHRLCAVKPFNASQSSTYIQLPGQWSQETQFIGEKNYGHYAQDVMELSEWPSKAIRTLSIEFVEANWLFIK